MPVQIHRNDELAHHGILGQKWGKRNGPPYPLKQEDHSKSEQKAGWKKSLSDSHEKQKTEDREKIKQATIKSDGKFERNKKNIDAADKTLGYLSDHPVNAKLIRTGALAAGAALTAYGLYKADLLDTDPDVYKIIAAGGLFSASLASSIISKTRADLKPIEYNKEKSDAILNSYEKIEPPESIEDSMANANSNKRLNDIDRGSNCMYCTTAMELRQRGYDVQARPSSGTGLNMDSYAKAIVGSEEKFANAAVEAAYKSKKPSKKEVEEFSKYVMSDESTCTLSNLEKKLVSEYGENARGNLGITFKYWPAGHSIYFSIKDGKLSLYDGQVNKKYEEKDLEDYAYIHSVRFDNAELNMEMLNRLIKS